MPRRLVADWWALTKQDSIMESTKTTGSRDRPDGALWNAANPPRENRKQHYIQSSLSHSTHVFQPISHKLAHFLCDFTASSEPLILKLVQRKDFVYYFHNRLGVMALLSRFVLRLLRWLFLVSQHRKHVFAFFIMYHCV